LYRNDRKWLDDHLPSYLPQNGGRPDRVLWDARDVELRAAVQDALLELSENRPGRVIQLWQVYQLIPELRAKIQQLDRLPLTKVALERAVLFRRSGRKAQDVTEKA